MNKLAENFKSQYIDLLRHYLNNPSESLRQQAYELARTAVTEGINIIDIMQIHHDELTNMLMSTQVLISVNRFNGANELLREVLAPFEIIFRGYRDKIKTP